MREAPLLVAVDAEERRGERRGPGARGPEVRVRIASAVTQELLLDLFPDALRYEEAVVWNAAAERVDAAERLLYGDLVLEEARAARADPEKVAALLAAEALARGPRAFAEEGALDALGARLAFAAAHAPDAGLAAPSEADLAAALARAVRGPPQLRRAARGGPPGRPPRPPGSAGARGARAARAGARDAPGRAHGAHPLRGREAPLDREPAAGLLRHVARGPSVAGGRVPLVLHLLAPNQRAVQVTTDLAGFWDRHYPALRRELMRRYPRHAWPEDPRTATPPAPRRR